jgi:outer membrane protein TolC
MKSFFILILTFIAASLFAAPRIVNVSKAVEIALNNNRNLKISRSEIKRMESLYNRQRASNYPSVSFSTQYSRISAIPSISTSYFSRDLGALDNYEARVSVKYLLFAWWSVTKGIRVSNMELDASRLSSRNVKEMLVYSTTLSFYRVLLFHKVHEAKLEAYKRDKEHFETVQKLLIQGKSSRFDLLKAKVHLQDISAQVISSKNDYEISLNQLKLLMGLPLREKLELRGQLNAKLPEMNNPFSLAYRNRNEIKILKIGHEMLKLKLDIISAENKPRIYLFADTFLSNPYLMERKYGLNWFAGIKLEINVFDGFAQKHKYKSALQELRQNELRLADTVESIKSELREVSMNLKAAREILKVREESVSLANEALKIAKISYKNGVITNLDVLDSELSYLNAKLSHLEGVYNVILGIMNLKKATGTLL